MKNVSKLKLPITQKQLAVLILLYRYRFLNRTQIQSLLNHKTAHRVKTWLKDLNEKQYINRIYSKHFGSEAKPAIYYLTLKSRQILKQEPACNIQLLERVYTEKQRSERFRCHCMTLADIYLGLRQRVNNNQQVLHFFTSTDLTSLKYLPIPLPDAYIAIDSPHKKTRRYFISIIDEHTPRFALRTLIQEWDEYFNENTWQEHTGLAFPKVILIYPNLATKKYLLSLISEEEYSPEFLLTIRKQIDAHGVSNEIWDEIY
jgi:hypothetical protein